MTHGEKLALIQQARKSSNFKDCLYPDKKNCSKSIVRAHSIQNKKILARVCDEKGEVLVPDIEIFGDNPGFNLKRVGHGIASTFTGLCAFHDNVLFKSIEDNDYEMKKDQDVYFALRSVIKELYAKMKSIIFLNPMVINSDMTRIFQLGCVKAEQDLKEYLSKFYKHIENNNFDFIETRRIIFNKEFSIALNSCINLTEDFNGKTIDNLSDFKHVPKSLFINIFPQKGKTYILLSYMSRDRKHFQFLEEQLINKSESIQKIRLTNVITLNVENLVISPKFWDSFTSNEKAAYSKLFLEQIAWKKPNPILMKTYNYFNWFKEQ